MTTGDCKFLKNILAFTSNISFMKISLVELIIYNKLFKGTKDGLILPGVSKYLHLKVNYLVLYFKIVLYGFNCCK